MKIQSNQWYLFPYRTQMNSVCIYSICILLVVRGERLGHHNHHSRIQWSVYGWLNDFYDGNNGALFFQRWNRHLPPPVGVWWRTRTPSPRTRIPSPWTCTSPPPHLTLHHPLTSFHDRCERQCDWMAAWLMSVIFMLLVWMIMIFSIMMPWALLWLVGEW